MGLTYEEIFDFSYFKYKYLFHKNEKAQKVVEKKREKNEKALAYLNSEENNMKQEKLRQQRMEQEERKKKEAEELTQKKIIFKMIKN